MRVKGETSVPAIKRNVQALKHNIQVIKHIFAHLACQNDINLTAHPQKPNLKQNKCPETRLNAKNMERKSRNLQNDK